MEDWGISCTARVSSDSSSARSFSSRRGLGRQRHVQTRYLWLQQRVAAGHLTVHAIRTQENEADLMTKVLAANLEEKHMSKLGQYFVGGRSQAQRPILVND